MTTCQTYPHLWLRLDLYVAQVQASMMAQCSSAPSIVLEQTMSRQGR